MKTLYPFRYAGNKQFLLAKLPVAIDGTLYEPFLGSGSVSYNVTAEKTICSDRDPMVIDMHKALAKYEFKHYKQLLDFIGSKRWYLERKEGYYAYRDWYNRVLYGPNHPKLGLGTLILANSCMNGLLRFGPDGFNQSSGKRAQIITEREYRALHHKASTLIFKCCDFRELTIRSGSFVFADPPYLENKAGLYEGGWTPKVLSELLKTLHKTTFWYTDTRNKVNTKFCEQTGHKMQLLKSLLKQSPGGKEGQVDTGSTEILITNYKRQQKTLWSTGVNEKD